MPLKGNLYEQAGVYTPAWRASMEVLAEAFRSNGVVVYDYSLKLMSMSPDFQVRDPSHLAFHPDMAHSLNPGLELNGNAGKLLQTFSPMMQVNHFFNMPQGWGDQWIDLLGDNVKFPLTWETQLRL